MQTQTKILITTVGQYNAYCLTAADLLTGRQFRRQKRAGILNLIKYK